jgi:hypothetical protein
MINDNAVQTMNHLTDNLVTSAAARNLSTAIITILDIIILMPNLP